MSKTTAPASLYIPVFSITLFMSAFLLFSIQPLFGKMVLPLLGGAPMVWNTAMLFYQAILLLGYAYAHLTSRYLNLKIQALLHIVLFTIFAFVLPFYIDKTIAPPIEPGQLVNWQIILMAVTIGGPFFVLSGCAPMLQYWFSKSGHKDAANPYFLYGASNLGSILALLLYPAIIEPNLTLPLQSIGWGYGYYALIAMIALSAIFVWGSHNKSKDPAMQDLDKKTAEKLKPSLGTKLTWLALAFLPSSLMLGVTTHISTDLAAFPLLWIIPLALYVGTFIIVFSRTGMISIERVQTLQFYFFIALTLTFIGDIITNTSVLILLHLITFFLSALLCHKQLERIKPNAHYLTEFYLIMSVGGVCGGIFNTLIAPNIFILPLEYGLVLALISFARHMNTNNQGFKHIREQILSVEGSIQIALVAVFLGFIQIAYTYHYASVVIFGIFGVCMMMAFMERKRWLFSLSCMIIFMASQFGLKNGMYDLLYLDRNYFGVTRVYDDAKSNTRIYLHGTTMHGAQSLDEKYRLKPITYYSENGPSGNVFELIADRNRPNKIGAIGLGIGSVACFTAPQRSFDFYDINPVVKDIAEDESLFTYLSDCGSPYEIILGDARLTIQKKEDKLYDLIFLDAFSSDNIPIHLITKEAFDIYFNKLKDDGIIVTHVSNRFMDLRPLIDALAKSEGATALFKNQVILPPEHGGKEEGFYINAIYTLMSKDEPSLEILKDKYGWKEFDGKPITVWTDDFANPLELLLRGNVFDDLNTEAREEFRKAQSAKQKQEQESK